MRTTIVALLATAVVLSSGAFARAEDGSALFQKNCAGCHGPDGKAQTPAAKAMKVPAIAGTKLTPEEIVAKLKSIEKHKSLVGKLSDADLLAIAQAIPPAS